LQSPEKRQQAYLQHIIIFIIIIIVRIIINIIIIIIIITDRLVLRPQNELNPVTWHRAGMCERDEHEIC